MLQCCSTVQCYSCAVQYSVTVLQYGTVLQLCSTVQCYSTAVQYSVTMHSAQADGLVRHCAVLRASLVQMSYWPCHCIQLNYIALQCIVVLCGAVKHSAMRCKTERWGALFHTAQCSVSLLWLRPGCYKSKFGALHWTTLDGTILHCTALYCTLYCSTLYCPALY